MSNLVQSAELVLMPQEKELGGFKVRFLFFWGGGGIQTFPITSSSSVMPSCDTPACRK